MNEILKDPIIKQSLLRADIEQVESKRKSLWIKILKIDTT